LVIDCSKYLDHMVELDIAGKRCAVEPGIVLDELNRRLSRMGYGSPSTSRPPRAQRSAAW
jgi:FAD/FMN-containing dehydrogenase